MRLKELKEMHEKAALRMSTAKKMLDEAKDEAGKTLAQKAYEDARKEETSLAETLTREIAEAKTKAQIEAGMKELESLNAPVVPPGIEGKSLSDNGGLDAVQPPAKKPDPTIPGAPVDVEKKMLEQENLFHDFLQGKSLTGGAINALQPNNRKLVDKAIEGGAIDGLAVAIPPRIWAKMIGAELNTKALPMASGDGSAAGGRSYLFWPEYDKTLQKLPPEDPSLFMRVRKIASIGGEYKVTLLDQDTNDFGSVVVSRQATEGADANETEAEFKQTTINACPLDAYTEITRILLYRDRYNVESELMQAFRGALENRFNYEIMHGTGTTGEQCLGLRQDDDVNVVARDAANTVGWDDLIDLESAIRVKVRNGAAYCISDAVKAHLKKKKVSSDGTTDQRPLFTSANMIAGGVQDRLNDYPWFVGTDMSALGTNGDVIFGNFSHYWFLLEQEGVISRSDHYQFKKGRVCFRIDSLAGGRAIHPSAFAVLVGTGGS